MARTTKAQVDARAPDAASLIANDASVFIADASLTVDQLADSDPSMSAARLLAIESYLSAYLAVQGAKGVQATSFSQGRVSASRQPQDGLGALHPYARAAIALDTSGKLLSILLGKRRGRVEAFAIDTVPEATRVDSTLE